MGLILVSAVTLVTGAADRGSLEHAWARIRPAAVWCGDKNSTVTIEAHITGYEDVAHVRVVGPNEVFELYDDGTHGDATAGDAVYTVEGVHPYCSTRYMLRYGNAVGTWYGTLEVELPNGDKLAADGFLRVGLVHPRYGNAFRLESYGDGLSATVFAFFVEDIDREVFDAYPVSSTSPDAAAREAVRKLYSVFADRFDFALVMPTMPMYGATDLGEVASLSLRVSNAAEHIGLPLFNRGSEYGSSGLLKGVIYHSFGTLDLVDSEMASLWAPDLGIPLGLATDVGAGRLLWNPLSDVGGQLCALYATEDGLVGHLAPSSDGTWQFVTAIENPRYAPLELYAMGLLPASEVPPVHLLSNPDLSDPEHVTAASVTTITIDDVLAANGGTRVNLAAEAPVEFSLAFVVVGDEPFTAAEYAYFSLLAYELTTKAAPSAMDYYAPFFWATGGRAALRVLLPVAIPVPSGM